MKTIFKEGMEVWDKTISPNKGKVIEVLEDTNFDFPIKVEFEDGLKVQYTNDGCFVKSKGAINTLSTSNYSIDFKGFEQKAPVPTFEDAWNNSHNSKEIFYSSNCDKVCSGYPTQELADASEALRRLLFLRDYYNEGWQPDWNDSSNKHCIILYKGEFIIIAYSFTFEVLHFKSIEIRDKFLEEQRELLEIAKPLL
ncbi:hypothetical protein [Capnocytophaga gingivalis]|uniref:hypothetical protein n=1 Tax=Capnocytophaga gingivalis TaxID=1017 RepID=UPI002357BB1E|nr:hypothetical protein [Capnocytophaga gingivalis]